MFKKFKHGKSLSHFFNNVNLDIKNNNPPKLLKLFLVSLTIFLIYVFFMIIADPYALLRKNLKGKILPNFHMYHYNYLKHFDHLDSALIGSSSVNYYSLKSIFGAHKKSFSMGIESGNISEHLTYGRLLKQHNVNEVIVFITFYSLNPSRVNRKYFNKNLVLLNNTFIDFFYQYFNKRAFKDAINYLKKRGNGTLPRINFYHDGQRKQFFYSEDPNYEFKKVVANYLAWEAIDPEYFNSKIFSNPKSILKGIEEIRLFREEMELNDINVRIVYAPVHRLTLALIEYLGLWNTFQESRRQLAILGNFTDLNLEIEFNGLDENWWSTHHVRNTEKFTEILRKNDLGHTLAQINDTEILVKPNKELMLELNDIFINYKKWDSIYNKINELSETDINIEMLKDFF